MGDNRDQSSDGRDWGFVERKLLVGRALFVWFSLKPEEEGGLSYTSFERDLGFLGLIIHFPRGLIYDLFHPKNPKFVRWSRIGMSVK